MEGMNCSIENPAEIAGKMKLFYVGCILAMLSTIFTLLTGVLPFCGLPIGLDSLFQALLSVAVVVALASYVVQFICCIRLRKYNEKLGDALVFFVLYAVCGILLYWVNELGLPLMVFCLLYYRYLYKGLAGLCEPFPEIAKKWSRLFLILVVSIAAGVIIFLVIMKIWSASALGGEEHVNGFAAILMILVMAYYIGLAAMGIMLIPQFLATLYAKRSRKAFAEAAMAGEEATAEETAGDETQDN